MALIAKQVLLSSYANGPIKIENFSVVEEKIDPNNLLDGEVLIRNLYLSVDPGNSVRMSPGGAYSTTYLLNKPITVPSLGEVIRSKHPKFQAGNIVAAFVTPTVTFYFAKSDQLVKIEPKFPISYYVNALGHTGLSAYFGLLEVCHPKANETVVVSGAAGAVGYLVGQIAKKIRGCKVIGIAGTDEKVKFVKEKLHFDEAINYKATNNLRESLQHAIQAVNPGVENPGIDVYFDNVGGETLDIVLTLLNHHARISICGQISQYRSGEQYGLKNTVQLLLKSAKMEGFIVFDYLPKFGEATAEISSWLEKGILQNVEDVVEGIENFPKAFVGMMTGDNIGRRIVKIAEPGKP